MPCMALEAAVTENAPLPLNSVDEDEIVNKEIRNYKVGQVRKAGEKKHKNNRHKLINNAVANIQAVEKSVFAVGH